MLPQSSGNFVVKLFGQLPLQIVLIIFLVLPITGTVWLLEYLSFEDEADTGHEFLLSVAVLLIGSVHCIVIAQWITLPILQLSAIAKAIEQGQWDKTVTINHFYELVQLAESFNRVFAQLRDVTENAEQRVQERTAQLVLVNEQLQHEIAERKQVEQALQAREGLLNAILQNLPLDFFVRDKFERLIMQSAHSIQRYVIGTLPEEANIDPQTLAVWKENNRRVFRGETVRGEFEREVDGQLRLFYEIKAPMYIEGRIEGLVGFSLDITDHKQAEEALRQANEQLQQRVNELTSLNFVAQTVATITDLPTTLKIVAETMIHLFDSQRIAIALLDAAQSGLKVVTHQAVNGDGDSFVGLTLPLASTPTAKQVLETGQIMVIPNLQTSLLTTPILDFLRAQGAQCLMLVPLLARAEIIGVIYLATNEAGRVFTPTQVTLAQTIAAQIAGAIETARRFDQERRQRQIADSLREVATILNSSLDQPIVLTRILEQLARVIPNDGSGIFLQQDEALLLVGGIGPAARTNLNARLPLASQNPTARVFKTQQLIIITDLNTEPHWLIWPEGHLVRSWMGAPLIVGQQVIGALTVDNFKVGAYHEEDGQILQTFANQAALAIQNARLFEALRRYERIVSATPDGISLLDRNYVYQIVNQTYLNASNKSRDQVVGHTVSELLSEEVFEKVVKAELDEALAGETVHYQAWFDYPALGRRFISVTYYPYREPDNTISGVVASTRDLTELELLAEQLRQAQKMEAVGQLAAGVAHHFNNMLTVIMGYVSLALRELPPYHPIAENLERVQVISQRAAAIVWQILAFARKQLIRPEMVNLNELVLNAETKLKQLIPAAIELHTRLAPDLGLVKVDVYQFGHLLSHLVANARDAMPQGGWLTLATANISVPPGQSAEVPPGSYVLLTVSDTGVGMTEEVKAHLFEPFFTTKEVGQGTGLGLATCFGIVKQHGGYITLDSQPGQGATFKIYLPRVP